MPRTRYTNPVENLRSYVMVKGGIDRDERMADVEFCEDVAKSAEKMRRRLTEVLLHDITDDLRASIQNVIKEYDQL